MDPAAVMVQILSETLLSQLSEWFYHPRTITDSVRGSTPLSVGVGHRPMSDVAISVWLYGREPWPDAPVVLVTDEKEQLAKNSANLCMEPGW